MLNLLIFVMRLLARMPLPWLRAVGHGLGWSLWHLARKRRRVVTVNLKKCMPELSESEREALAYRHFVVFGQSVLDRAWRRPEVPRRVMPCRIARANRQWSRGW